MRKLFKKFNNRTETVEAYTSCSCLSNCSVVCSCPYYDSQANLDIGTSNARSRRDSARSQSR